MLHPERLVASGAVCAPRPLRGLVRRLLGCLFFPIALFKRK